YHVSTTAARWIACEIGDTPLVSRQLIRRARPDRRGRAGSLRQMRARPVRAGRLRGAGKNPLVDARHRFDDRDGLGCQAAPDVIALLLARTLHVAHEDARSVLVVRLIILPEEPACLAEAPRRVDPERRQS